MYLLSKHFQICRNKIIKSISESMYFDFQEVWKQDKAEMRKGESDQESDAVRRRW